MIPRGFSFRLDQEKIREFKGLSAEEKLDWLEEANDFIAAAVSDDKRQRWERLKANKFETAGAPRPTSTLP